MENVQQNDWFATILYNPDKDFKNFQEAGLDAANTGLKDRESYKDIQAVQDQFKDAEGNFDEKLYNQFYDSAVRTYNTFVQGNIEDKFLRNMVKSPLDILSDRSTPSQKPLFIVQKVSNPTLKSQGINSLFGEGKALRSYREAAQTQRVVDYETGKELDWTPDDDDKSGFFDFMFVEPLVEAKWEEDGFHKDEYGREIKHFAGDYKLNANGMPYYETLGDRDAANKSFLHWTDTLTTTGSKWDKYNFLASDGIDKSVAGTTAKMIATIAPLFIPYVGQAYGIATASVYFGQAMAVFGKTVIDAIGDDTASKKPGLWQFLNKIDSSVRKFDSSVSDAGNQGMFNYEQFANLVTDVVGQLYQQRSIAKIPQWIGWDARSAKNSKAFVEAHNADYLKKYGKTLRQAIKDGDVASDYTKLVNNDLLNAITAKQGTINSFAKNGSQFYMAMTQSKDMYDTFKENGFSDTTTAIGMGAALYGFSKLFNSSLGEVALSGLGLDDLKQANKRLIREFSKEMKPQLELVEKTSSNITNSGKIKWIKNLGEKFKGFYEKHLVNDPEGWIANSVKDSIEEVSEEALQDVIFESSNVIDWTFNKLGWTQKRGNYEFTQSNPLERYLMSALGGAVGGAIFPAITKMENIRDGVPNIQKNIPENLAIDIATMIRNNGVQKSVDLLKKSIDKGEVGSTTLSMTLSTNTTDDGQVYYEPAKKREDSQNNIVGNILINYLYAVDSVINNEGYNLKDNEVVNNSLMKDFRLKQLADTGVGEEILYDFQKQLQGLITAAIELKSASESSEVGKIKQRYDEFKQRVDDTLSGKRAGEYAEMMAYKLNRGLMSPFAAPDIYAYSRYVRGINYATATEQQKKDLEADYEKYTQSDQQKKINLGYEIFKNMKAETAEPILKYRDSQIYKFKSQLYDVISKLNDSQNISKLSDAEIVEYKEEVRNGRSDDQIIADAGLNPEENVYSAQQKAQIVDSYLEREIWNSNPGSDKKHPKPFGKAYVQNLKNMLENMKQHMSIGVDPILNQRRVGELQVLFESINNIVQSTGFIDAETKEMIDTAKQSYNRFSPESFVKRLTMFMDPFKGFTFEDSYVNDLLTAESTYLGRIDEVDPAIVDELGDSKGEYVFEDENGYYALTQNELELVFTDMFSTEFDGATSEELLGGILKDGNLNESSLNTTNSFLKNPDYSIFNKQLLEYLGLDVERIGLLGEIDKVSTVAMQENPVWDMLSRLSTNLIGEDVFKVLKAEEGDYKSTASLYDYVISNELTREQLETANTATQILSHSIIPYLTGNEGVFNMIDIANQYKRNMGAQEDVPLTQEEAQTIQTELQNIQQKIAWLLAVNDMNSGSKTVDSSKTMGRLNSMFALILSGNTADATMSRLKNLSYTDADENEQTFIEDDLLTGDELVKLQEIITNGKNDEESLRFSNEMLLRVSKALYDKFSDLTSEQKEEIIGKIAGTDVIDYNDYGASKFKRNSTYQDIKGIDLATYLLSTLAVDPTEMQSTLRKAIISNPSHAPFYNQMFSVQEMYSLYKNPVLFNKFLQKTYEFQPIQNKEFYAKNTFTKNIITVLGGAGTGKSTGVAKVAYNMIKIDNPDASVMVSGPKADVGERLAATLGIDKSYDRLQLFQALLTDSGWEKAKKAISEFRNPSETKPTDTPYLVDGNPEIYNQNFLTEEDVNIAALPDVLFVDEFTHFSGLEMQMLASLSKFTDKEMIIYALGDNKQEGIINPRTGEELDLTGMYFGSPVLTSSIRANNVHKKDNLDKISSILSGFIDKEQDAQLNGTKLSLKSEMRDLRNKSLLKYYELITDKEAILHGDKLVNQSELTVDYIQKLINNLKEGERIALITDNVLSDFRKDTFHQFEEKYPEQVVVRDSRDVQGSEFKYTIVDVKWTDDNNPNMFIKNLKYFYTLMSRSADGNLIVKKDFNMVAKSDKASTTSTSELKADDIDGYKKLILSVLKDNKPDVEEAPVATTEGEQEGETVPVAPSEPPATDGNTGEGTSNAEQGLYDTSKEDEAAAEVLKRNVFEENDLPKALKEIEQKMDEDATGDPNADIKARTMSIGSYYNHLALNINEDGIIQPYKSTNGVDEDLSGFANLISGKTLEDIRDINLESGQGVDLLSSLAYMRSLFKRSAADLKDIVRTKLSSAGSEQYKALRPFIELYFDGRTSEDKFRAFKAAIAKGNWLVKLTKYKPGYDKAHNVENLKELKQDELFGRVVFQLKTKNGYLDITLGSTTAIDKIIASSGNQAFVNILNDRATLNSKIDQKGQVYFRLGDFQAKKKGISFGGKIFRNKNYNKLDIFRQKYNRGRTLDQTIRDHPELLFSDVYMDGAVELDGKAKRVVKGYPTVFMSDDLWGVTSTELLDRHLQKMEALQSGETAPFFEVTKGHLNLKGLSLIDFMREWGRLEGENGGKIYGAKEFFMLARPVEAARFLYSMLRLNEATVQDIEAYNRGVDAFNSNLLPSEEELRKDKIAVDPTGDGVQVSESALNEVKLRVTNMLNDLKNSFPELVMGKIKPVKQTKAVGQVESQDDSTKYSVKNTSYYMRMAISPAEQFEMLKDFKVLPEYDPNGPSNYIVKTLQNLGKTHSNLTTLLEKLVDPDNDIYSSPDIDPQITKNPESKKRAIQTFLQIQQAIQGYEAPATAAIVPLVKKGVMTGFTASTNVIRHLFYNTMSEYGPGDFATFKQAIDYGNLYKFGVWTNGIDTARNDNVQLGYYISALGQQQVYFDGPIQTPDYYINYDALETDQEFEVNQPTQVMPTEGPAVVEEVPRVEQISDKMKLLNAQQELIANILNSVENNVTLQKDDIKRALETIDITKFNLNGETVEDRIQSFNAQYISKVRDRLSSLPRKLYTNDKDVATITPEYIIDKNNNIIPDPNAIVSLAEHINENELLKNTEINTVTLENSDIKLNAEEQSFTVRVNGSDYIFGYENNEAILKDIRELPKDENPQVKFVEEFDKGVQSLISTLGKSQDITKLSKLQLMKYNKGKAIADLLSVLDINAIASELFNSDAYVADVVDKYAPADADANALEGVKVKLQAVVDSLKKNNEGKPNC